MSEVLDYLREQFALLHTKLDHMIGDVGTDAATRHLLETDNSRRLTTSKLLDHDGRLDAIDTRLNGIEATLAAILAKRP